MNMGSCSFSDPPLLPRLKATLERCLRLTEGYTDVLLEVLPERAGQLGRALGVEDWVVRTFTEGEVRASLVFQLSKLAAMLLVAARSLAGVTPWDTLVAGTAVGTLREVETLDPAALSGVTEPVVLLLREADGDEEVSAAGKCVRGVVLTQELPHLSHLGALAGWQAAGCGRVLGVTQAVFACLPMQPSAAGSAPTPLTLLTPNLSLSYAAGVRARQERVPFVTIEDRAVIQGQVVPLLGQKVVLVASPEGAQLRPATSADEAANSTAGSVSAAASAVAGNGSGPSPAVARPGAITKAKFAGVVPLLDCAAAIGGAKAAACAQLEQVGLLWGGDKG
jgi:phosphoglucan,water dikinase